MPCQGRVRALSRWPTRAGPCGPGLRAPDCRHGRVAQGADAEDSHRWPHGQGPACSASPRGSQAGCRPTSNALGPYVSATSGRSSNERDRRGLGGTVRRARDQQTGGHSSPALVGRTHCGRLCTHCSGSKPDCDAARVEDGGRQEVLHHAAGQPSTLCG
jgi:hypothetical protein